MRSFFLLFVALLAVFASCSNDFELNAPSENIAVVYGFLDKDDEVHYIRVERAFIDPETNALEIAKNPDSLYYTDALVELIRLDKNETITLKRVNAAEEGLPREDGIFASDPNVLYRFSLPEDEQLEGGERVQLRISLDDVEAPVTAETQIIGDIEFAGGKPSPMNLQWRYNRPTSFAWTPQAGGVIFDLILTINFQERTSTGEFIDRSLEWVVQRNIRQMLGETRVSIDVSGERFYQFLQAELSDEPRMQRFLQSIDVRVVAGGQELLDFLNITQANTGITSAQEVPFFTNLEGNGVGLFTSRSSATIEVTSLSEESRDSLRNGIYTRGLNFQ